MEKYKTVDHISECNKLTQKEYKTMYDWGRKVIYWELLKSLNFDYTTMHKPESVLENEIHEIL